MKPSDLTYDEVREELMILIEKYPNRHGNAYWDYTNLDNIGDSGCVYYKDENGIPVSPVTTTERPIESVTLVEPVCMVGEWIESFHPSFKENEQVRDILVKNKTMVACSTTEIPFNNGVKKLLALVQEQQDMRGTTWGQIDLDFDDGE